MTKKLSQAEGRGGDRQGYKGSKRKYLQNALHWVGWTISHLGHWTLFWALRFNVDTLSTE